MSKIKYDVSDVEPGERTFVQPQPGLYGAKIVEANHRNEDGKNDIQIIVEITDKGEFQGARVWSYVSLGEPSRWKVRELTDALGLPAKGEIDTSKLVGKKMTIKVNADTWEGEYRARLHRFLKTEDSVDGDDDDDDDDDDVVVENTGGDSYDEWELDELLEEAETRGILGNISGRKTKAKLIEALEASDAGPQGSDDEPEESAPEDDYDEWSLEELTDEFKDRELELPKGRKTKDKLVSLLREDDSTAAF